MIFLPYHKFFICNNGPSLTDWLIAIGTIGLAIVAIWGERLRRIIFRPKLKCSQVKITNQNIKPWGETTELIEVQVYRLPITNIGSPALQVSATVIYISNANPERFIPIPLNWTHVDDRERDISTEDEVFLDLFQRTTDKRYAWQWPKFGFISEKELSDISKSDEPIKITIKLSEKYSVLRYVNLVLNYKEGTCIVENL